MEKGRDMLVSPPPQTLTVDLSVVTLYVDKETSGVREGVIGRKLGCGQVVNWLKLTLEYYKRM